MTFDEANKLIKSNDPYDFSAEERKAFDSFGIKLNHFICEECVHLSEGCKAINCISEDFVIKQCNYFSTVRKKDV